MTAYTVTAPRCLRATIQLPASKSISNRALIVSALAGSHSVPENVSNCDDTFVMTRALTTPERPVVDIMAAGTAMRFLTAYYSVTCGERILTGTERMLHRPIGVLVNALRALGADIEYTDAEGFPPLRIRGKRLHGGEVSLPGNVSSQYISALMMIGPVLTEGLRIVLTGGIVSRPYIDLTMRVMRTYGTSAEWASGNVVVVKPGEYCATPYYVENDWSAASYWYEMVALAMDNDAEVYLPGLFSDSGQGDQAVKRMFATLGVQTVFTADGIRLVKGTKNIYGGKEAALAFDFTEQPDLAQTLVVTCCIMGVPFRFTGLQSLRIKETDRIAALECELRKWGYVLHDAHDSVLWWDGERCPATNTPIDTYDDHRMAMAFAPAALVRGVVTVNNPQVVSKSYPAYWDTLRTAGFEIKPWNCSL